MDVDNTYFFQEMKFHEQDIHKALIFNLNFLMFLCILYPYSLVDPIYTSKNLKGLLLLSPFEPLITSTSSPSSIMRYGQCDEKIPMCQLPWLKKQNRSTLQTKLSNLWGQAWKHKTNPLLMAESG